MVDPGLFEHAHPVRSRGVRLAGLPEAKCGRLGHVWVGAGYVDHECIGGYLNVGGEADAASVLDQDPLYKSRRPLKSLAEVSAARPGMTSWPGESRCGRVSARFSWAVNPSAAHTAIPSRPLPIGIASAGLAFGSPSTMSDRPNRPPASTTKCPAFQAVVETRSLPWASTFDCIEQARLSRTTR